MSVALIQPQFAPNFHDLLSMISADRVFLLDADIWSRKGRTHRAKITSTEWINIPIKTEDKKKSIRDVRIDDSQDWFTPFWNGIYHNFHSTTYFDYFEDELMALLTEAKEYEYLIDFNLHVFLKLRQFLELDVNYERASETSFTLHNASIVYQEFESKNYIHRLENAEILSLQQPELTAISELSILHVLFHYGPESFRLIDLLK